MVVTLTATLKNQEGKLKLHILELLYLSLSVHLHHLLEYGCHVKYTLIKLDGGAYRIVDAFVVKIPYALESSSSNKICEEMIKLDSLLQFLLEHI